MADIDADYAFAYVTGDATLTDHLDILRVEVQVIPVPPPLLVGAEVTKSCALYCTPDRSATTG